MEKKTIFFIFFGVLILVGVIFLLTDGENTIKENLNPEGKGFIFSNVGINNSNNISYEYVGDIIHIWNKYDDYCFNKTTGLQFGNCEIVNGTLEILDYTENIWCFAYETTKWNYKCADNFPMEIIPESDNLSYAKVGGNINLTQGGVIVNLKMSYDLNLSSLELAIPLSVKHISGPAITNNIAFAWRVKNIDIDHNKGIDYIKINNSVYNLNDSLDLLFSNMTTIRIETDVTDNLTCELTCGGDLVCEDQCSTFNSTTYYDPIPYYRLFDSANVNLRWNPNLNYFVQVKSKTGQTNAPVTLALKTNGLNIGQTKSTTFYWRDPVSITVGDVNSSEGIADMTYTATAGSNRLLLAITMGEGGAGGQDIATLTYAGVNMLLVHESKLNEQVIEYFILNESQITSGANDFVSSWTPTNPSAASITAFTFLGVNQTDPYSNRTNITAGSNNDLNLSIIPEDGGYVIFGSNQGRNGAATWTNALETSDIESAGTDVLSTAINGSTTTATVEARVQISGAATRDHVMSALALRADAGAPADASPTITLNEPLDSTSSSNTSYIFNFTATDDQLIDNITLQIFNTTGLFSSTVNTTTGTDIIYLINITDFIPETYTWNVIVFDNASQSITATNFTLTVTALSTECWTTSTGKLVIPPGCKYFEIAKDVIF